MKSIAKAYESEKFENDIYTNWEKSGYFQPQETADNTKKPFVIMMPPPNVTGKLHIGHSLFISLEDLMTRYHRMKGNPTLWLPGMDHAGIATQTVVDKQLRKEGINKNELGREKFVEKIWEWKENYGGIIFNQIRKMGASCDWSRERFTLDPGMNKAVNEAFVRLYNKGLIYRGEYIVNWCPKCQTAISDDEVEHEEQKAKLYYFRYDKNFPIVIATTRPETKLGDVAVAVNPKDKRYKEYIGKDFDVDIDGIKRKIRVIGERSVDEKFGTGAVGVTPAHSAIDWRMAVDNKLPVIKVINEYGKMTAETGHYEGLRTKEAAEKLVQYFKDNGLFEKEEEYSNNLSICYRCNTAIEPLPSKQWFVKMAPLAEKAKKAVESGETEIIPQRFEKVYYNWMDNIHDWCISRQLWWGHQIPVWYKKASVESKTWNLKIFGEEIFNTIRSGPESIETRAGKPVGAEKYWGDFKVGDEIIFTLADKETDKPIEPVQSCSKFITKNTHYGDIDELLKHEDIKSMVAAQNEKSFRAWYKSMPELDKRVDEYGIWAIEMANERVEREIYVGTEPPKDIENWEQDPDVLDTWFSSALWPFSTLGWPEETEDFKKFYPTSVLETGYDILPFWVARMMMFGIEFTGKAPFKTVYFHGLVRDEHNRKMSKSLGNSLDPLDIIPKYSTDALRMALLVGSAPGQDLALGESKIKGYRNFTNKIWNASRFTLLRVTDGDLQTGEIGESEIQDLNIDENLLTEADRDILKKHKETIDYVSEKIESFKFSLAGERVYEYFWHEFCDSYIEETKNQLDDEKIAPNTKKVLIKILSESLLLLHPFVPFVTEAVWQELRKVYPNLSESIMISKWPVS